MADEVRNIVTRFSTQGEAELARAYDLLAKQERAMATEAKALELRMASLREQGMAGAQAHAALSEKYQALNTKLVQHRATLASVSSESLNASRAIQVHQDRVRLLGIDLGETAKAQAKFLQGVAAGALGVPVFAGAALAAGYGVLKLAEAMGSAADLATRFEHSLVTVQNNVGLTDAETAQMRQTILSLHQGGPTLEALALGYEHVADFAFRAADAQEILNQARRVSVATDGDVAKTAELVAATLHHYNLEADQAQRVTTIFYLAAQKSKATFEEVAASVERATAVAANLGVPLEEVVAAEAALTRNGFNASEAQTQLINIFTHMINPAQEARDEIERISELTGVDLVADFTATGFATKGLAGIIDDLREAFKRMGLTEAQSVQETLKLLNAQRGGLGMAVLAGKGYRDLAENLKEFNGEAKDSEVILDAYNRQMRTADGIHDQFNANLEKGALAAGGFLSMVRAGAEETLLWATSFGQWRIAQDEATNSTKKFGTAVEGAGNAVNLYWLNKQSEKLKAIAEVGTALETLNKQHEAFDTDASNALEHYKSVVDESLDPATRNAKQHAADVSAAEVELHNALKAGEAAWQGYEKIVAETCGTIADDAARMADNTKKSIDELNAQLAAIQREKFVDSVTRHSAEERESTFGKQTSPELAAQHDAAVQAATTARERASLAKANQQLAQSEANLAKAEAERLTSEAALALADAQATGNAVMLAQANQKVAEATYARAQATVKQREADLAGAQASLASAQAAQTAEVSTIQRVASAQANVTAKQIALSNAQAQASKAAADAGLASAAATDAQKNSVEAYARAIAVLNIVEAQLSQQEVRGTSEAKARWDAAKQALDDYTRKSEEALHALDEQLYQNRLSFKALEQAQAAALIPLQVNADIARQKLEAIQQATRDMDNRFDVMAHQLSQRLYPLNLQLQAQRDALAQIAARYSVLNVLQAKLNALHAEDARIAHAKQLAEEQTSIENLASQLPNLVAGSAQWLEVQKQMAEAQDERNRHEQEFSLEDRIAQLSAAKEAEEAAAQSQIAATEARISAIEREQALLEHQRQEYDYEQRQKEIAAQKESDDAQKALSDLEKQQKAVRDFAQAQIDAIQAVRDAKAHDDAEEAKRLLDIAFFYETQYNLQKTYYDTQHALIQQNITDLQLLQSQAELSAKGISVAFVDGIAAQIAAGQHAIAQAMINAMLGAIGETQVAIEAHSPSLLAARLLGQPIPEGVALGIVQSGHAMSDALIASIDEAFTQSAQSIQAMQELWTHVDRSGYRQFSDLGGRDMGTPGVVTGGWGASGSGGYGGGGHGGVPMTMTTSTSYGGNTAHTTHANTFNLVVQGGANAQQTAQNLGQAVITEFRRMGLNITD